MTWLFNYFFNPETDKRGLVSSHLIFTTTIVTVLISIFAHGLTAYPGANWYANRMDDKQDTQGQMPENKPVPNLPVRLPWRQ